MNYNSNDAIIEQFPTSDINPEIQLHNSDNTSQIMSENIETSKIDEHKISDQLPQIPIKKLTESDKTLKPRNYLANKSSGIFVIKFLIFLVKSGKLSNKTDSIAEYYDEEAHKALLTQKSENNLFIQDEFLEATSTNK